MNDADRERWAEDHWDYQERIGAMAEDVVWCPHCHDDSSVCDCDKKEGCDDGS